MDDKLVIDVSKWDGNVDYQAWVNKHDLWGVIIKAGGNEGGRYEDSWFDTNYHKAKAAGLHIGAYYYTVSTDEDEAREDADHFADILDDYDLDLPAYMDVEDGRQFQLSKRELTDVIESFCDRLQNRGYYAGLYTGGSAWLNNMYTDELLQYANWIAWWQRNWPTAAGDIGMWQQGAMRLSDGDVVFDDVSGYTDLDWCRIDYPSKIKGNSSQLSSSKPVNQDKGKSVNNNELYYQAHCQKLGWLEQVKDGQIAGTTGQSLRLEALKINPPEGIEFKVTAHIQSYGNKEYTISNGNSEIIGTVGKGRRLEAITIKCLKNNSNKNIKYQGHIQGIGWGPICSEGELCGTVGKSKRLEAIKIWLEDGDNNQQPSVSSDQLRQAVVNVAKGQLGARYNSMDYGELGWGCAMLCAYCLNSVLGTEYYGSVYNFSGDALGHPWVNQGGGEFEFTDNPQPGDVVVYMPPGYDGTDYDDYGHAALYIGDDEIIGSWGKGNIGNWDYFAGRGVSQDNVWEQSLGGDWRYVSCTRFENGSYVSRNNRDGGTLTIDGDAGWNTIIDWQHQLGTTEDGCISGQNENLYKYFSNISSVTFENNGSELVAAIQKKVGAKVDGYWGSETSIKIKEWLVKKGYLEEFDTDQFGENSVKALQKSLNDKAWE